MAFAFFSPFIVWLGGPSERAARGPLFGVRRQSADTGDAASNDELLSGTDRLLGEPNAQIVQRVRAGDDACFTALFHAYAGPLARWAFLMTRDAAVAEEAAADVLASVWERRTVWQVRTSVEAYLFGAVRARVRARRRVETRRSRLLETHTASGDIPGYGASSASPDFTVESDARATRVIAAIQRLPERQRDATLARWHRGFSYDEVGHMLGISALAARQLVFRALETLRAALRPEAGPPP